MRAAIYLSPGVQDLNGREVTIVNQRRKLSHYCKERGWDVGFEWRQSDGPSAPLTAQQVTELLREVEARKCTIIVVATEQSLPPLNEGYTDLFHEAMRRGVELRGVLDGYDSRNPFTRMLVHLSRGLFSRERHAATRSTAGTKPHQRARKADHAPTGESM